MQTIIVFTSARVFQCFNFSYCTISANIAVKPLGHFDHFDPFKVKMSKTDKSHNGKRTFDDIIQEVDKIPIPKNGRKGVSPVRDDQCAAKTARKSATNNHRTEAQSNVSQPNRKSILRPSNQPRHHRKNIILNMDKNEIKEFEAGSDEDNEIIQQVLSFAAKEDEVSIEKHPTLSNFQRDPIHKVIANILQWEVDWLTESDQEPQVNGHGLVEMPMLQRYESFEMYQCTIIPLMMRELWAQIRGDYRSRKSPSFNAEVIHANDERRGVSTRRVFMCKSTYEMQVYEFTKPNRRIILAFSPISHTKSHDHNQFERFENCSGRVCAISCLCYRVSL